METKSKATLALAMIVKPSSEELFMVGRALTYIRECFDEVCITLAGNRQAIEQYRSDFEELARHFSCGLSEFEWINDFAAARNYNFKQATADYIMWIDADDWVENYEAIPKLMRKISEEDRVVDTVVMEYLYDFDEYGTCVVKHLKTRIVKNDGCVEWVGALHEDFKPNRQLLTMLNEEIKIVHQAEPERIRQNFARNTEIAKAVLAKAPDDPRSYWLVANALLSEGRGAEALNFYYDFIERSSSEEEMYLAWHRIASIFEDQKDYDKAFMAEFQALRLRPWYPDAYFGLGRLYYALGKYRAAETVILDGLRKPVPKDEIVVYNPRDYDVNPLNLLARVYFALNRPNEAKACLKKIIKVYPQNEEVRKLIKLLDKEARRLGRVERVVQKVAVAKTKDGIKAILDKVPKELRSHPAICNIRNVHFVKTNSSGRDLVFYCGFTEEEWTPETARKRGIGGSEEAIINLTRELAARGWRTTVYNNCGYKELIFDDVIYKPFWAWNYRDKQDVVIIWRQPKALDFEINAPFIGLDLHDVISPGELNSLRINRATKIFVKSQSQRALFPHVPDDKFAIIPNGVDTALFGQSATRNPYYLINTSSPDRSLATLLDLYIDILARLPEEIRRRVKLGWYYGWNVFDSLYKEDKEAMEWRNQLVKRFEDLRQQGYVEGGQRISHPEIAKKYLEAGALVYPSEFYEIDFISGAKAQLAGCVPITTDFAALGEKIQYGVKIHSNKTKDDWTQDRRFDFGIQNPRAREEFMAAVVDYLLSPQKWDEERQKMSEWARSQFNWPRIAELWHQTLEKELK